MEKDKLLKEVNKLISVKKELYSNMSIEDPMSDNEKELNKKIALIWSEVNSIIRQERLSKAKTG